MPDCGGKGRPNSELTGGGALARAKCVDAAIGPYGIHISFADPPQSQQGRYRQNGGDEKHGLRRHKITAGTHDACGKPIADRGKARIAAQSLRYGCVAYQAERDGGDGRAENRARTDVQ